jgi:hypothetical protein
MNMALKGSKTQGDLRESYPDEASGEALKSAKAYKRIIRR